MHLHIDSLPRSHQMEWIYLFTHVITLITLITMCMCVYVYVGVGVQAAVEVGSTSANTLQQLRYICVSVCLSLSLSTYDICDIYVMYYTV